MLDAILLDIDKTISQTPEKKLFKKYKDEIANADYSWFIDYISTFSPTDFSLHLVDLFTSKYRIIFLSARNEKSSLETEKWINTFFNFRRYFPPKYFYRTDGDDRPDHEVKRDILINNILPKYNIIVALDDRRDNCIMYNELGITSFQVRLKKGNNK
jgi:hypothetical protein